MASFENPGGLPCVVSSVRVPISSQLSFAQGVMCLRGDRRPFALAGDWLGGLSVLGSEPVCLEDGTADPFAVLDRVPHVSGVTANCEYHAGLKRAGGDRAVVGGGWVGWLGYGLGSLIERLPPPPPAPVPRALSSLAYYDHVVVHDGEHWWFEALSTPARERVLRDRRALWERRLSGPAPVQAPFSLAPLRLAATGPGGHVEVVGECRRRIFAGELFQANLCVRLESRLTGDPLDLFCSGLRGARPRFAALADGAVSLSPERFLRRVGRRVWTEPIKGTRPRTDGEPEQTGGREELIASGKDAAEHVMIVDLMRNDLGRVCEYDSIVAEPVRAEAHAGVWHLVSTVAGTLRPRVRDSELLRAAFPPGSVTGAPKVQAMKVISELESTRRELYTGAIGLVSPLAGLDLSVAIRTFEIAGDRVWFGAGGGIVADSSPAQELAEALDKARGPVGAVGGAVAVDAATRPDSRRRGSPNTPRRGSPNTPPRALAHGTRPDPAAGVFETILVVDGVAVSLRAHLERLAASARVLYGRDLDLDALAAGAIACCREPGGSRLRLRVLLDADGGVWNETTSDDSQAGGASGEGPRGAGRDATASDPVGLAPFVLPGGLGAHKWRDRSLLEALAASVPGAVPLLVDSDGAVLEAGHANVWIVEGDRLLTPPADGRLLAGVTRAGLLESDRGAGEAVLDLARLARADSIFLTSSISGLRPARLR
jgi:para-aminobenzoate synthetase/4-amino-4-deoxychorismate lyase